MMPSDPGPAVPPAAPAEDEVARLKAELAELRAAAVPAADAVEQAAEIVDPPAPTHDLLLSNGQLIPHTGAIPTLVHLGEDLWNVVAAFERKQP